MAARSQKNRKRLQQLKQLVERSRAKSTNRSYANWFKQFQKFCLEEDTDVREAGSAEVVSFLQELLNAGKSASSLAQASSAIAWNFKIADRPNPTKSAVVQAVIGAAKRTAPPVKHKEPGFISHLKHLRGVLRKKSTFSNLRTYVMSIVLYTTCSRLDEIIDLKRCHAFPEEWWVRLDLPRTKTDQIRDGNNKFLPIGLDPDLCPRTIFMEWLARPEVGKSAESALFPAFGRPEKSISETTYSENLKLALRNSGLPPITGHGWRSGFASSALEGGADVASVQLCGLWADPKSLQSYVRRTRGAKIATAHKAGI